MLNAARKWKTDVGLLLAHLCVAPFFLRSIILRTISLITKITMPPRTIGINNR